MRLVGATNSFIRMPFRRGAVQARCWRLAMVAVWWCHYAARHVRPLAFYRPAEIAGYVVMRGGLPSAACRRCAVPLLGGRRWAALLAAGIALAASGVLATRRRAQRARDTAPPTRSRSSSRAEVARSRNGSQAEAATAASKTERPPRSPRAERRPPCRPLLPAPASARRRACGPDRDPGRTRRPPRSSERCGGWRAPCAPCACAGCRRPPRSCSGRRASAAPSRQVHGSPGA
jgi:hypothetical protein